MTTKEKILQTALKLFNETNTQTATTNHIAKAMGISPGNLHYHYKNREEIIQKLYQQMRAKMSLPTEGLPKTIIELNAHQKVLIEVFWEYRFFYKELLFLFSRDETLQKMYISDNLAHRSRIKQTIEGFIVNGEIEIDSADTIAYVVDAILMSIQFYTSYLYTLGEKIDHASVEHTIAYTNETLKPYVTRK
jgi:AcrR family transcriptional regulator